MSKAHNGRKPKLFYTHGGKTLSASQWGVELGVSSSAFRHRIACHPENAFHKGKLPPEGAKAPRFYEYEGEFRTASEIAALTNYSIESVHHAYKTKRPIKPKPFLTHMKPMQQVSRPYFTFSRGGRLKTPPQHASTPSETPGGIDKLSPITP